MQVFCVCLLKAVCVCVCVPWQPNNSEWNVAALASDRVPWLKRLYFEIISVTALALARDAVIVAFRVLISASKCDFSTACCGVQVHEAGGCQPQKGERGGLHCTYLYEGQSLCVFTVLFRLTCLLLSMLVSETPGKRSKRDTKQP